MINQTIFHENESYSDYCLSIGGDIAAISNKDEFVRFLGDKLTAIFGFDQSTIYLFNQDKTALHDFLAGINNEISKGSFAPVIAINNPANFNGGNMLSITTSDLNINESSFDHKIWTICNEMGKGRSLEIYPLVNGKGLAGYWVMYFPEPELLNQQLKEKLEIAANHISLLSAKLRSEELLLEYEGETENIQSLNTDFTSIRDRRDLLKVIHYKLKRLFDFSHQWVAVINEDQLTMTSFLQEPQLLAKEHPRYQQVIKTPYPTNDNFINNTLLSRDAHIFDIRQISLRQALPEYLQVQYESGVNKIVMTGLHVGDRIIGVWAICLVKDQRLNERQLNLIKGISNQLSIAVDNIIAYEAIKNKEAEREQLLKLSYEISTVRAKEDLVKVINNNVRKLFSFENINILLLNEDPLHNSYILASPFPTTFRVPGNEDIADPKQMERIYKGFEMMQNSGGVLILDLDVFVASDICTPYLK